MPTEAYALCPMPYAQSYLIFLRKAIYNFFLLPLYFTIIVVHLIAICCKLGVQKFWQVNSSADKVGVEDFRGCSECCSVKYHFKRFYELAQPKGAISSGLFLPH